MPKKKPKNCSDCKEKIVDGMDLMMNKRTICLGCAVERGILQQLNSTMSHVLNCSGDAQTCAECFLDHREMMPKLWCFMTDLLTAYQLTREVDWGGSC